MSRRMHPHMVVLLRGLACLCACQAPSVPPVSPGSALPLPVVSALPGTAGLQLNLVTLSPLKDGGVTVTGGPGAITGDGTVTLDLALLHDLVAHTTALRIAHDGSIITVGFASTTVNPDGSFGPVSLGSLGVPAQRGDLVWLAAHNPTRYFGDPQTLPIP